MILSLKEEMRSWNSWETLRLSYHFQRKRKQNGLRGREFLLKTGHHQEMNFLVACWWKTAFQKLALVAVIAKSMWLCCGALNARNCFVQIVITKLTLSILSMIEKCGLMVFMKGSEIGWPYLIMKFVWQVYHALHSDFLEFEKSVEFGFYTTF